MQGEVALKCGEVNNFESNIIDHPTYQMSCLPLPLGTRAKMGKKNMKTFYWKGFTRIRQ